MDTIVYRIENKLYINLTNRCSNSCVFCVRNNKKEYENYSLWLSKEPSAEDVIQELGRSLTKEIAEVVFCGYGEPLYRLDAIVEIARFLKEKGYKTRINTNGQADLIIGKGVASKLRGYIDTVNVSLNACNPTEYQAICKSKFGEEAFFSLLRFADELKGENIDVVFSVISTMPQEEQREAEQIAKAHGARLRVRQYIA